MVDQHLAIIALGSNLGDSKKTLQGAMDRLQESSPDSMLRSSVWRSSPVDCPPGSPDFLNAVVAFVPVATETPESLLQRLQSLEREFGRGPKTVLNEARPLDLDLIAFGQLERNSGELTLPHPRAHQRRFVLQPLSEIAPNFVMPGQTRSVRQLLELLDTREALERVTE